jgi:dihydrofolate reductase
MVTMGKSRTPRSGKVVTAATVSLDGYIAGPNETGFEHLFAYFDGGDFEIPMADPNISIKLGEADYHFMRDFWARGGVFVSGRRLFDLSDGWAGAHPMGWPVVVVTHSVPQDWVAAHPGAPFTFVTDGVAPAIEQAKALAGDLDVVVASGKISSQCLELGLLDEITLQLVPVLLGGGVPLFEPLAAAPILLDGPTLTVQGNRVTHLRYTVRRNK